MADWDLDDLKLPTAGLLGAYGLKKMHDSIPGGSARMTADYARNFLPGAYAGPIQRKIAFGKEIGKVGGRMGMNMVNVVESLNYRDTGLSNTANKWWAEAQTQIRNAKLAYIDRGKFNGVQITSRAQLRQIIRTIEKQVHFKLTNDYANQFMFGGQTKYNLPKGYAKDIVSKVDFDTFMKDVKGKGKIPTDPRTDRAIAEFVLGRQGVDVKGTTLLKYKNTPWADVLRGAQFDRRMYKAMLDLKDMTRDGVRLTGRTELSSMLNSIEGIKNATPIGKNRIIFELPGPQIKPNYDWGGYNASAIWDKRRPGMIRLVATDKRDVGKFTFGGKQVVNYVSSKEISIPNFIEKAKKELSDNNADTGEQKPKRKYVRTAETKARERALRSNFIHSTDSNSLHLQNGKISANIRKTMDINTRHKQSIYKNFSRYSPRMLKAILRRSPLLLGGWLAYQAISDWYTPE